MKLRLLMTLLLLAPAGTAAQVRAGPPTVSVDASASVEREPDRAVLTLAVESEAETAQAASQANAEAMARVIGALRQAGLAGPAVRTLSIQLTPVYASPAPNRQEPPRIAGYRARNMVQATIDSVPQVGRIVDTAIAAGANRVAGLSFELKDRQEARLAALTAAMEKARLEAETVARAAGRSLGPPVEISLGAPVVGPRPMFERNVAMAQVAETPVEGGTLTITATVHVVYRLGPS